MKNKELMKDIAFALITRGIPPFEFSSVDNTIAFE